MGCFYFKLLTADGLTLHNSIPESIEYEISSREIENGKFEFSSGTYKHLRIHNTKGTVQCISNEPNHLNSSRLLQTKANIILESLPSFLEIYSSARNEANQHVKRLIHNLVTLNAHNIQEVYSIIPQDVIQNKNRGQRERLIEQVNSDPYEASLSFVRIAKNSLKMKTEIEVYNALLSGNLKLKIIKHQIHRVLMNVFYVFFPDFTDKGILVDVSESNETMDADYETFQVAIYHIIENSVKYIRPESTLRVEIIKNPETKKCKILFKMISLEIKPHEIEKIFEEGYSGEMAKKCNKSGSGIGMHRAKTLLAHNKANLSVIPKYETAKEEILGYVYQENLIVIDFY